MTSQVFLIADRSPSYKANHLLIYCKTGGDVVPLISIGNAEPGELLMERLSHEALDIAQAGIILSFQVRESDGVGLIEYTCDGRTLDEISPVVRSRLADILADMVLGLYENKLSEEILRRHYACLSAEELSQIAQRVADRLQKETVARSERRARVAARFRECLDEFRERLDLEGFVRFRLRDYQQEIQRVVACVVEEHFAEREHREFIQLLRYFVDLQKPKTEWVQVVMSKDGFFRILDRDNLPIHAEYLDGFVGHHQEINYDDLLISALITIAPAHLVIHALSFTDRETVETICSVFAGRCTVCSGCPLCE